MKRLLPLSLLLLLVAGCSNTAVLRIVEYRAGTVLSTFSGTGIAVHQSGKENAFAHVEIIYEGERALVTVVGGEADAVQD